MHALSRIAEIQSQAAALTRTLRPQSFEVQLHQQTSTQAPISAPSTTPPGQSGATFGAASVATDQLVSDRSELFRSRLRAFPNLLEQPTATMSVPDHVQLPARADEWLGSVQAVAERHDLPPALMTALVWSESAFRPDAVSHAGAIGLSQLMPGTAAMMNVDPWDPQENLEGGARYLAAQLDRFESVDLALAAYNAGPARVARVGCIPDIAETPNYVRIVMERYQALEGGHS